MNILAIDASTDHGAVAVCQDQALLSAFASEGKQNHSETLLPLVQKALKESGLSIGQIDLFVCAVGPGSFTGVRMAVSLVKGLAFDSGKPCVGVSSLAALAYNLAGSKGIVCPVIDARRGNVYNALYREGVRLTEDRLIDLPSLEKELEQLKGQGKEDIFLVGDGYDLAKASWSLPTAETPAEKRLLLGHSIALAGFALYEKEGRAETADQLRPEYLRPSQAERERLAALKETQ